MNMLEFRLVLRCLRVCMIPPIPIPIPSIQVVAFVYLDLCQRTELQH